MAAQSSARALARFVCSTPMASIPASSTCQPCRLLSMSTVNPRNFSYREPMSAGPLYADRQWNINIAVCLYRPPTVACLPSESMSAYHEIRDQVADETAVPSHHDKLMDRFKRMKVALEERARGEVVADFTQEELTGDEIQSFEDRELIEDLERNAFAPSSRITGDDLDNVLTSTNRLLDRYLYLLVRHKSDELGWHFPTVAVDGTVALREEVERFVPTITEPALEVAINSNAPSAVYSLRGATSDGRKGSKVFVYMAHLRQGAVEKFTDSDYLEYRWLPSEEIKPLLPEHARSVSGMLYA